MKMSVSPTQLPSSKELVIDKGAITIRTGAGVSRIACSGRWWGWWGRVEWTGINLNTVIAIQNLHVSREAVVAGGLDRHRGVEWSIRVSG